MIDSDPLPFYALKLLLALLEHNPTSIAHVERLHLVPVLFQVLLDHQNNVTSTTMQQMAGVLQQLVAHKQSNMKELYENGASAGRACTCSSSYALHVVFLA